MKIDLCPSPFLLYCPLSLICVPFSFCSFKAFCCLITCQIRSHVDADEGIQLRPVLLHMPRYLTRYTSQVKLTVYYSRLRLSVKIKFVTRFCQVGVNVEINYIQFKLFILSYKPPSPEHLKTLESFITSCSKAYL